MDDNLNLEKFRETVSRQKMGRETDEGRGFHGQGITEDGKFAMKTKGSSDGRKPIWQDFKVKTVDMIEDGRV